MAGDNGKMEFALQRSMHTDQIYCTPKQVGMDFLSPIDFRHIPCANSLLVCNNEITSF